MCPPTRRRVRRALRITTRKIRQVPVLRVLAVAGILTLAFGGGATAPNLLETASARYPALAGGATPTEPLLPAATPVKWPGGDSGTRAEPSSPTAQQSPVAVPSGPAAVTPAAGAQQSIPSDRSPRGRADADSDGDGAALSVGNARHPLVQANVAPTGSVPVDTPVASVSTNLPELGRSRICWSRSQLRQPSSSRSRIWQPTGHSRRIRPLPLIRLLRSPRSPRP